MVTQMYLHGTVLCVEAITGRLARECWTEVKVFEVTLPNSAKFISSPVRWIRLDLKKTKLSNKQKKERISRGEMGSETTWWQQGDTSREREKERETASVSFLKGRRPCPFWSNLNQWDSTKLWHEGFPLSCQNIIYNRSLIFFPPKVENIVNYILLNISLHIRVVHTTCILEVSKTLC